MIIQFDRYYELLRLVLSLLGVWPYLSPKSQLIRTSCVQVFINFIIVIQAASLATMNLNLDLFLKNITFTLFFSVIYFAYNVLYFHGKSIKIILDWIKWDFQNLNSTEELIIFEKYYNKPRLSIIYSAVIYYTSATFYVILEAMFSIVLDIIIPLNESRPRELPIPLDLLFLDREVHFFYYLIITYLAILFVGIVLVGNFGCITCILHHICGIFYLAQYTFSHALDDIDLSVRHTLESEKYRKRIIRGIRFHNRAFKHVDAFNSLMNKFFFVQVILASGGILVGFIRIFMVHKDVYNTSKVISCSLPIFGVVLFAYVPVTIGQNVIDQSDEVRTQAYMSKWYMSPVDIQKLYLMVIKRCSKPIYIELGKWFTISKEFYLSIIQTIVSYAMVLYSLQ